MPDLSSADANSIFVLVLGPAAVMAIVGLLVWLARQKGPRE